MFCELYASVAQMEEHLPEEQGVGSPKLPRGTICGGFWSAQRAVLKTVGLLRLGGSTPSRRASYL